MTLDRAIKHALDVAASDSACTECRKEHEQLAEWLLELKHLREREDEKHG